MASLRRSIIVALLASTACAELPQVDVGRCGNGVVEPDLGEDCDRAGSDCGEPGEVAACRWRCGETAGGGTCPAGACGLDDACHVPSERFVITADLRWTSPTLVLADTTDDDYPELIGVGGTQMELHRGSADGGYTDVIRAPNLAVNGAPASGDLDGDGLADLVLPVNLGLFAMVGDPFAVLQPVFQTSFPLPTLGRVEVRSVIYEEDGAPTSQVLVALRLAEGTDCGVATGCQALVLGDAGAAFPAGREVEQLAAAPMDWAFQPNLSPTAIFVVLAFADDDATPELDESGVFGFIGDPATESLVALGPLSIPGNVLRGAWLADVDGDGADDLLVAVHLPTFGAAIVVGWGRGNGAFDTPVTLSGGAGPVLPGDALEWADLDADGDADMITTLGARLTSCVGRSCGFTPTAISSVNWVEALAADVNGDGRGDLVGHDAGSSTLEVMLGSSIPLFFNEASLAVPGEIVAMRAGDYDGNGLGDLAVVTRLPDVEASDELYVAFGRRDAPPAPVSYVGHIGTLLAIDNAMTPVPGQLDVVDDLILLSDRGGLRGGALVLGSTSQRMSAPLIPTQPPAAGDSDSLVEHVVILPLDNDGLDDVVALVSAYPVNGEYHGQLRAYTSDAYGGLAEGTTPDQQVLAYDTDIFLPGGRWVALPATSGGTPRVVGGDRGGRVIALPVACAEGSCTTGPVEVVAAAGELGETLALSTADVDGDGDVDLLGAFGAAMDGDPTRPPTVRLWRNDDGFAGGEVIEPPAGQVVVDVAAVDLDLDGVAEVLLVTRDDPQDDTEVVGGVWIARVNDVGAYAAPTPFEPLQFTGVDLSSGLYLRAQDVNGDGLVDVALMSGADRSSPRTLVVAVQLEHRPGQVVVQGL